MTETILSQLSELGYRGGIVPLRHVNDLEKEITDYYTRGLFDEEFYNERLRRLKFSPPESLPEARSIIIIAWWGASTVRTYVLKTKISWDGLRKKKSSPRKRLLCFWKERSLVNFPLLFSENSSSSN